MRHYDWSPQQMERITTHIGCASHSASSDKVLDEWRRTYPKMNDVEKHLFHDLMGHIKARINLRQQTKRQE
jgi:hypothetical protein